MTEVGGPAGGTRQDAAGNGGRRRAPRWMWITLVVSLSLNLLAFGTVAGAIWHARYAAIQRGSGIAGELHRFVHSLPRDQQAQIRAIVDQNRGAIRELRSEARTARRGLATAMAAEPFVPGDLRAAHERVIQAETKLREASQRLLPQIVEVLSADERKRLASWRGRERGGWWRRGRSPEGDDEDRPPPR